MESTEFPQKTKTDLLYDPVIPLLDIYDKGIKSVCQVDNYTEVNCSNIHSSQEMKTNYISLNCHL